MTYMPRPHIIPPTAGGQIVTATIRQLARAASLAVLLIGFIATAIAQTPPPPPWPHEVHTPSGATVTIYQPQVISWTDHKSLTARAAIAIARPDKSPPVLGTIEISAATQTDFATRSVLLSDFKLLDSHFPSLGTDQAGVLDARIKEVLPTMARKDIPLDTVLLAMQRSAAAAKPVTLNNDPPVIFYSAKPASLVVFDGDPVLAPVEHSSLRFAVNTNWDVFVDPAGTWYLLNNGVWLSARAYSGPWQPVARLPAVFNQMPNDQNFGDVRRAIPAHAPSNPAFVPTILVSTKPAEIIVTGGPPVYAPIPGTQLQYVSNTEANLFRDTGNGQFYFLVSGRWFSAASLDGPWRFATRELPPDFGLIPPDSAKGNVLAAVPGTQQAQLSVLEAQIPHEASLKRASARLEVTYTGAPEFRPIPGTSLTYAVNTTYQVIGAEGRFYACYQGAWFVAPTPTGPWTLADSIPQAIYSIPPSSPEYNVTYVQVYGATPEAVTYGYTAGYAMGFVTAGVLFYGTGWYYPPVIIPGPVPVYFPYPWSYAGGIWWNSATGAWAHYGVVSGPWGGAWAHGTYYNGANGAWAHGGAIYGPYGGAAHWSYYNPHTGTYAHGSAAWGPNGVVAHGGAYNPRYGVAGTTTQHENAYARWGSSTVSGANRTMNTASASNAHGAVGGFSSSTGAKGAGYHGANGNSGGVVKGPGGDVYAGHDGNVYQHGSSGWSKWNNGGWQPVQPPARGTPNAAASQEWHNRFGDENNYQQLEQDRQARFQGYQRQSGGWNRGGGGWRR
jgi:hypothetical protein